jgi:hypothetical protein
MPSQRKQLEHIWGVESALGKKGEDLDMNNLLRATAITSLLLLGTSLAANAADLPPAQPVYKAPPAYAPPQFSWTGFYIGGNLGGGWNQGISAIIATARSSEEAKSGLTTKSTVSSSVLRRTSTGSPTTTIRVTELP